MALIMKFHLINDCQQIRQMLVKRGHQIAFEYHKHTDWDAAIFPGGADVHPFFYGEKIMTKTSPNLQRDIFEIKRFKGLPKAKLKIGICRGAQLLNVLCGGSLYQHVTGHTQTHSVQDYLSGDEVKVTSTHHQMMIPADDALVLASTNISMRKERDTHVETYDESNRKEYWDDPESVYYEDFNTFCFQPHPEYDLKECTDLFFTHLSYILEIKANSNLDNKQEGT